MPALRRGLATSSSGAVRPLLATLPHARFPFKTPELSVDHLVIGGGVVGLSIAASLAREFPSKTTYLIERNRAFGEETSSRNSEVIHAGLYYPAGSLKTQLCLEGRELMYARCQELGIPHKQVQKLVVGGAHAKEYLEKLKAHCDGLGPLAPATRLITGEEARMMEPDLAPSIAWALLSERTGIVSSHELMASLEREIMDADNAEIVYDTAAIRVDPSKAGATKRGGDESQEGWVVQTQTSQADTDAILAKVVVNASGLNAPMALNSLIKDMRASEDMIPVWHSKGNYASYKGSGAKNVKHLIYPVPDTRKGAHSHTSLGTHLTLDLDGNIRFGPDTEWISPPNEDDVDFWCKGLTVPEERIESMYEQITEYLPGIDKAGLAPDYAGIRPKLIGPGQGGFMDFTFLWHRSKDLASQRLWQYDPTSSQKVRGEGGKGAGGAMISLLGIESPGLTSSLAIGSYVQRLVSQGYYGAERESKNKGARNSSAGSLEAWA